MNEEQFADALDGIVNGKHPVEPDPLAAFARNIHQQEGERMPDDRRSAIWKQVMGAHPPETTTTGGAGPLSQPTLTESTGPHAFDPWVGPGIPPGAKRTRLGAINDGFQVSISALAIAAIVIAAFAAFPIIRGDRGPEITPTAFAAAPTTSAPSASTDAFAMNATQALPGTAAATPDLPGATATPRPGGDLPIMIPTATDIPWFPYPPVIDPGPAGPVDGTPGPFTPAPIPPILPLPGVTPATPPSPTPSSPPTRGNRPLQAADCTVEPLTVKESHIPMVPDYAANSGDSVYVNGSATLTVVWTNQNGVMIREGHTGIPALEKNLPNVWTFFWDEALGRWLLDGYGVR